ncbi:hypothetical protein HanXRQr2_Chr17g0804801 [Helianthus annuus]|uniref:Uncharacterized protein n=1 Tax=Helianthus annuus TaxID=4232 RepID=A0A9K3DIF6_HELAN|nr:hypothetical protein HanXRQr2_Chr17g0804801 [Helianthus annuus]KAJ0813462.1 hypothetical protein HanPSC8_Chr17g0773691 [Helianthus annuus]
MTIFPLLQPPTLTCSSPSNDGQTPLRRWLTAARQKLREEGERRDGRERRRRHESRDGKNRRRFR